ncbi:MAG TPA: hypothetical protein VFG76_10615, partial [Candidatus Polarisedimenticolia bacterium]|nr:hypothetical protein [Candidatus Polarisedimenticolia bacterium]
FTTWAVVVTALILLGTFLLGLQPWSNVPGEASETPAGARVLVVLPFVAQADDPETAFFGVGLADSLISRLSGIKDLKVRPLSASLALSSQRLSPAEIGRRLGAATVMQGSYTKTKDSLKVRVGLMDVDTGAMLLDRELESSLKEIMRVEVDLVEDALAILTPHLHPDHRVSLTRRQAPSASAHYLYLLARGKMATLQSGDVAEVVRLLEEAVSSDPSFAQAHAALSEASANMVLGGASTDGSWIDRAIASGRRAVFLADGDPEAHYALGYALSAHGDTVGAARESLKALRLDPDHGPALRQLAVLLAASGAGAPARHLRDHAREVDPSMELGWIDLWLAVVEGTIDETAAALEADAEARRKTGGFPEQPIMQLGYVAFLKGDAGAGLRWAAMLENVSANAPYTDMVRALALARNGGREAVGRIIEKNHESYWKDWDYATQISQALALTGETEQALEWLRRSVELGSCHAHLLESSDAFDVLRADPRFGTALGTVRERAGEMIRLARFAGYG